MTKLGAGMTEVGAGIRPLRLRRSRLLRGQNSVNTAAFEVDDLEVPACQLDHLALYGQLTEGVHEQACQGVVAVFVFGGQFLDVQPGLEFVDGHDAVE